MFSFGTPSLRANSLESRALPHHLNSARGEKWSNEKTTFCGSHALRLFSSSQGSRSPSDIEMRSILAVTTSPTDTVSFPVALAQRQAFDLHRVGGIDEELLAAALRMANDDGVGLADELRVEGILDRLRTSVNASLLAVALERHVHRPQAFEPSLHLRRQGL